MCGKKYYISFNVKCISKIKLCGRLWNICQFLNKYISKVFKWLAHDLVTFRLHVLHLLLFTLVLIPFATYEMNI